MSEEPGPSCAAVYNSPSPCLSPDLARLLAQVMELCDSCQSCRRHCAFLQQHGKPGKIAAEYDPANPAHHERAFLCSLCGLCTEICPKAADPAGMFWLMRREAVRLGMGCFPQHKGLKDYEALGFWRPFTWYGLPQGCSTVFFPGCALPGMRPRQTRQLFLSLQGLVPNLGALLCCCARPSHDLGRQARFEEVFFPLVQALTGCGIKKIVCACPGCQKTFVEYGAGLEVISAWEILAQQADFDPVFDGEQAAVHDSCALRGAGSVHDAVRLLLAKRGFDLQEMNHCRAKALCCGEGGAVKSLNPSLADAWTRKRHKEAGSRLVVSYCAGCMQFLNKGIKSIHLADVLFGGDKLPLPSALPQRLTAYFNRLAFKHWLGRQLGKAPCRGGNLADMKKQAPAK
ncbi:MAG: (Fe-S)-binding protein [Desulfatibacillaceae bacterium]|nr:(Fe-S)-binding protein [Desulfatibacillaceae bacterium]